LWVSEWVLWKVDSWFIRARVWGQECTQAIKCTIMNHSSLSLRLSLMENNNNSLSLSFSLSHTNTYIYICVAPWVVVSWFLWMFCFLLWGQWTLTCSMCIFWPNHVLWFKPNPKVWFKFGLPCLRSPGRIYILPNLKWNLIIMCI